MTSDTGRALGALFTAAILATGLVQALPALRDAGWLPEPVAEAASADRPRTELLYAVINLTDSYAALQACPLDLDQAQSRIETALTDSRFNPVFTPIAEGPDVLVHELEAMVDDGSQTCSWQATTLYAGQRLVSSDIPDPTALGPASRQVVAPQASGVQ